MTEKIIPNTNQSDWQHYIYVALRQDHAEFELWLGLGLGLGIIPQNKRLSA